jgi:hypothetical protein
MLLPAETGRRIPDDHLPMLGLSLLLVVLCPTLEDEPCRDELLGIGILVIGSSIGRAGPVAFYCIEDRECLGEREAAEFLNELRGIKIVRQVIVRRSLRLVVIGQVLSLDFGPEVSDGGGIESAEGQDKGLGFGKAEVGPAEPIGEHGIVAAQVSFDDRAGGCFVHPGCDVGLELAKPEGDGVRDLGGVVVPLNHESS